MDTQMHQLTSMKFENINITYGFEEMFNNTCYHHRSRSFHDSIVDWASDVEEAASLPPLTIIQPHQVCNTYQGHNIGPQNHFLQISLPIPRKITDNIRSQLSQTINAQNSVTLLRSLPHPLKAPLTRKQCPNATAIEAKYCEVMEARDLYWVQQLMVEKQLPTSFSPRYFNRLQAILGEVQTIIKQLEDAVIYIKRWGSQAWRMDFSEIELRRRADRPSNHPCNLLQPYVVEIPMSGVASPEEY